MTNNKKKKNVSKSVFNDLEIDKKDINNIVDSNVLETTVVDETAFDNNIKEVILVEDEVVTTPLAKSQNETFFEKFEKTKKDFSKDKRKQIFAAKKNISSKFKSSSLLTKINDSKFLKISWLLFISIAVLFIAYSSVVLGFLAIHFNGVSDPLSMWTYININLPITQLSIICASISLFLIVMPYIYLTASWFVGINSVYKSLSFFIFNITCLIISAICIILIICTSSIVFNFVINFKPIVA